MPRFRPFQNYGSILHFTRKIFGLTEAVTFPAVADLARNSEIPQVDRLAMLKIAGYRKSVGFHGL
jgi:hypothetical protein